MRKIALHKVHDSLIYIHIYTCNIHGKWISKFFWIIRVSAYVLCFSFDCTELIPLNIDMWICKSWIKREKERENWLIIYLLALMLVNRHCIQMISNAHCCCYCRLKLIFASQMCCFLFMILPIWYSGLHMCERQCVCNSFCLLFMLSLLKRPYLQWRPNDTSKIALFLLKRKKINHTSKH